MQPSIENVAIGRINSIPEQIPQYFGRPLTKARLVYKATTGSYKAPDYLQMLLQFTAVATLGGDPFETLMHDELISELQAVYQHFRPNEFPDIDPIQMAVKWAWAPVISGWVTFEKDELIIGVEALCFLLHAQNFEMLKRNLLTHYNQEDAEADERDLTELAQMLKLIASSNDYKEPPLFP